MGDVTSINSKALKVVFLADDEAAKIEKASLVPVYRVRGELRKFMCWAKRDDAFRGAVEIRMVVDAGSAEAEIEYSKSDA